MERSSLLSLGLCEQYSVVKGSAGALYSVFECLAGCTGYLGHRYKLYEGFFRP